MMLLAVTVVSGLGLIVVVMLYGRPAPVPMVVYDAIENDRDAVGDGAWTSERRG